MCVCTQVCEYICAHGQMKGFTDVGKLNFLKY